MPLTMALNAMGTRFELVLAGDDEAHLRAAGQAALSEIEQCHRRFNLFTPGSWLNTINRRAAQQHVPLDDLTFDQLQTAQLVHRQSQGAFDITIAPLMRAWGFHGPPEVVPEVDERAIAAARACVGMQHVHLHPDPLRPREPQLTNSLSPRERAGVRADCSCATTSTHAPGNPPSPCPLPPPERGAGSKTVWFDMPGITLDLGAIAKGFAIEQAMAVLRESGITCALLHGGTSTVAAIGAPPGQDGWHVALNVPGGQRPTICLRDQAMSVSAPHGRSIERDGHRFGHVLDPRSGRPATCAACAAVIGPSATLADAWSTALLVLGHRPDTMPGELREWFPDSATSEHVGTEGIAP
ncbi:MAG: FAD:protein FMN transferase [Phycisphaeraceae bacterium]|nr:FAD:protein FMN transferase [Phycisphaeraceae bacterium]